MLKTSKEVYDTAINQLSDKQYLEAIDTFKKVDKQDIKRYSDSEKKIVECKKSYQKDMTEALIKNRFTYHYNNK